MTVITEQPASHKPGGAPMSPTCISDGSGRGILALLCRSRRRIPMSRRITGSDWPGSPTCRMSPSRLSTPARPMADLLPGSVTQPAPGRFDRAVLHARHQAMAFNSFTRAFLAPTANRLQ